MINKKNPPPIQVLDDVIQACPPELLSASTPTPLSILLEQQASVAEINCILRHDCNRLQTLATLNERGETPLLQAAKHYGYGMGEDIVRVLVEYDAPNYGSLLIACKKRNCVPLYYMANRELANVHWWDLQFILFQTHWALDMKNGRYEKTATTDSTKRDGALHEQEVETAGNRSDNNYEQTNPLHMLSDACKDPGGQSPSVHRRFQFFSSTIACAHLLREKNASQLLRFLLHQQATTTDHNLLLAVDGNGDTLLHHMARAENLFLVPMIHLPPSNDDTCSFAGNKKEEQEKSDCFVDEPVGLLEYMVTLAPQCLLAYNAEGRLPLHVALESRKPFEFLHHLLVAAPQSLQLPTRHPAPQHSEGQVALHLAILQYPNLDGTLAAEVQEIWKLYPEAASLWDPVNALYPFQLAALTNKGLLPSLQETDTHATANKTSKKLLPSKKVSKRLEADPMSFFRQSETSKLLADDGLSSIYFFLRACPEVIQLPRV
ncbi:hypothetical protein ACA910_015071 [Epithemia clementina (nom. ined.)]